MQAYGATSMKLSTMVIYDGAACWHGTACAWKGLPRRPRRRDFFHHLIPQLFLHRRGQLAILQRCLSSEYCQSFYFGDGCRVLPVSTRLLLSKQRARRRGRSIGSPGTLSNRTGPMGCCRATSDSCGERERWIPATGCSWQAPGGASRSGPWTPAAVFIYDIVEIGIDERAIVTHVVPGAGR